MSEILRPNCPECADSDAFDRRDFIRVLGGTAATLAAGSAIGAMPRVLADAPAAPRAPRPAEELVRELYNSLSAEQRQTFARVESELRQVYHAVAERCPGASLRGLLIAAKRVGAGALLTTS